MATLTLIPIFLNNLYRNMGANIREKIQLSDRLGRGGI
jgi:hypothetical protein